MGENKQKAWAAITESWEMGKETVFFDDIGIAADGGLSDIGGITELWYPTRFIGAALTVGYFVYNMYYILKTDIAIVTDDESVASEEAYLLTSLIFHKITGAESTQWFNVGSTKVVVWFELLILCACFCDLLVLFCMVAFFPGYWRWHAVRRLCLERIPQMGSYSAMKLLYFINLQVLTQDISYSLFYTQKRPVLKFVLILASRPCMAIVGIDCFLIRYRAVQAAIMTESLTLWNLLDALIFVNQVLGVVMLTWSIRARLFRFVFGGEDGIMTPLEENRRQTWDALVAEVIWQRYTRFWGMQALVILLSWSDDDMQAIILREHDKRL